MSPTHYLIQECIHHVHDRIYFTRPPFVNQSMWYAEQFYRRKQFDEKIKHFTNNA